MRIGSPHAGRGHPPRAGPRPGGPAPGRRGTSRGAQAPTRECRSALYAWEDVGIRCRDVEIAKSRDRPGGPGWPGACALWLCAVDCEFGVWGSSAVAGAWFLCRRGSLDAMPARAWRCSRHVERDRRSFAIQALPQPLQAQFQPDESTSENKPSGVSAAALLSGPRRLDSEISVYITESNLGGPDHKKGGTRPTSVSAFHLSVQRLPNMEIVLFGTCQKC